MSAMIVLDAGHGGSDPGVTWPQESGRYELVEKLVTLTLARQLRQALLGLGWPIAVEMTREDDSDMSLHARGMLAEKYGADLVLSLHVNSNPEPSINGGMTFHWPGDEIGRNVAETVARCLPFELRRMRALPWAATDDNGTGDDWLRRARHVIGAFKSTAVLIETAHATNADDRIEILNPGVQRGVIAACIAGVAVFLALTGERAA